MILMHIGLPKTATTTLQKELFPRICDPDVSYVGVIQPRVEIQDPLYTQIYSAICAGTDPESARDALIKTMQEKVRLIISEEMFTVSTSNSTWAEKLRRLRSLLDGLNYMILCTVREPANAAFSYFTELHDRIFARKLSLAEAVASHEAMRIYKYAEFLPALDELFGEERVYIKTFTSIVENEVDDIMGFIGVDPRIKVSFRTNNSKRTAGEKVFTGRGLSAADLVRGLARGIPGRSSNLLRAAKRKTAPMIRAMDSWVLKQNFVRKPSENEINRIREHFCGDWDYCKARISRQISA